MLKRLRKNKKGFTLAELLIVVAIIGVLVAVSIPIFTSQLAKARLATNQANARSAHAAVVAGLLDAEKSVGSATYDTTTGTIGAISDTTTSSGAISTDPSTWTTSSGNFGTTVNKKWTVYVTSSGVAYSYSEN